MLIPVILSGGAGTRLWPVSREGHPKPFMKLADGETLLLKTYRRAADLGSVSDIPEILTVTNRDYFFMSKDELASASGSRKPPTGNFMLEPFGRNTAAAVALAAQYVSQKYGADAVMLVLAADHLIFDQPAFTKSVAAAMEIARDDYLVTFGITPTTPDTGFGYIEYAEANGAGFRVKRFVEKPTLDVAKKYLEAGNYLWNSGMFCFKAGVMLGEMAQHAPDVDDRVRTCWSAMAEGARTNTMLEIPTELFEQVPDISIDYAVMERSAKVAVVPGDFGWSDIGSWQAVSQLTVPDEHHNRVIGDAIVLDSRNTYIQSEGRLVAALGLDDLLIIDTADALLVAHRDRAQDIKKIVTQLKKQNHETYKIHRTVSRPWGTYTVIEENLHYKIKRIEVKPGASLSLQMHHHRSEHWIVVSGMAKVVNGDKELFVSKNESTYIPAGHRHRLENPGVLDLVMIEVQSGEYLGEDDIVRFQDVYGRV